MSTVLITGGTGMIGSAVRDRLIKDGHRVIILTRRIKERQPSPMMSYAEWDIDNQTIDTNAIQAADYIIHLAGANVADGRWTSKRKKEIVDSRVRSGALIAKSLEEIPNNIKAVISASAIGFYGPDTFHAKKFIETDPPSNDFLGLVVQQWEAAIRPVTGLQKRLVIFRTGIVLSNRGGAFPEFKRSFGFRIGAILGSGKQVVSWIHIDDLVALFVSAIENENFKGVYNAVAPNPVSNSQLVKTIGQQSNRQYINMHVPAFALKLALGEMSVEVLKSTTVSSEKIIKTGFQFLFPDIESAVANLMSK